MKDLIKRRIKDHALKEVPNECCGILFENSKNRNLEILECDNSSMNKRLHFRVPTLDYFKASSSGKILAFYHSHFSENDFFSEFDKEQSEKHHIKLILYCVKKNSFHEYEPKIYDSNYSGKDFEIGVNDCFTLFRDYYKKELDIEIKNYYRDHNWFVENPNSYQKYYEESGFSKILDGPISEDDLSQMRKNDVIFSKPLGKKFPTHAGIYMGHNSILHHQINCYSRIEEYTKTMKKRTITVIRHDTLA
jgi:proteasome lid subunit RPN8/RPN11